MNFIFKLDLSLMYLTITNVSTPTERHIRVTGEVINVYKSVVALKAFISLMMMIMLLILMMLMIMMDHVNRLIVVT